MANALDKLITHFHRRFVLKMNYRKSLFLSLFPVHVFLYFKVMSERYF